MMLLGRRDVWEILWGVLGNQHVVIRPLCRELCVGGVEVGGLLGYLRIGLLLLLILIESRIKWLGRDRRRPSALRLLLDGIRIRLRELLRLMVAALLLIVRGGHL